ncbi:MAG: M28 family peptidase [Chloroflexota bacterium]
MSAVISEDDARYAYHIVRTICSEVGPGLPGSPQERKRAAIIGNELASHLGAENVAIEEFSLAPDAFLGSLPISALFMLLAALSNISRIRFLGYGSLITLPTLILAFIVMLVMSAIQLAGAIAGNAGAVRLGTVSWVLLIFPIVPAIIFATFFNMGRKDGGTVPGAADNLSASALAVAMCRFLVKNPSYIPDNTEIRFISFGCEEAGLRGSRRYVERHLEELKRLDARLLNYETVAYPEISILTSDVNGAVRNSPEMVKCVAAAAERAGVSYNT